MRAFVSAFEAEAAPLIDLFELRLSADRPFRLYRNETTALVISGMGKLSSAAATSYLLASLLPSDTEIFNFGLCGAKTHPIGSLWQIRKVIDRCSGAVYHLPAPLLAQQASITCEETPRRDAKGLKSDLIDMESSGFLLAARHFLAPSRIHLLKVVSDHLDPEPPTAQRCKSLIAPHLPFLKELI